MRNEVGKEMVERERDRRREGEKPRDRDRDIRDHRDRDRERTRERDHRKRSRSPDHRRQARSRTRSPGRRLSRSRSRSADRSHRRGHHRRSASPDSHHRRKRHKGEDGDEERDRQRSSSGAPEAADGVSRDQKKQLAAPASSDAPPADGGDGSVQDDVDAGELEMMKKLGIPLGFDSTKGKPVPGADVSGVRAVNKRQPRQYMNRRGGFNRPLPSEKNR